MPAIVSASRIRGIAVTFAAVAFTWGACAPPDAHGGTTLVQKVTMPSRVDVGEHAMEDADEEDMEENNFGGVSSPVSSLMEEGEKRDEETDPGVSEDDEDDEDDEEVEQEEADDPPLGHKGGNNLMEEGGTAHAGGEGDGRSFAELVSDLAGKIEEDDFGTGNYTNTQLLSGAKLLSAPGGSLLVRSSGAALKLCAYESRAVDHLSRKIKKRAKKRRLNRIMKPWCKEYTKRTRRKCNIMEPFSEIVSMTRCIVEAGMAVGCKKAGSPAITPAMFSTYIEIMTEVTQNCFPQIAASLGSRTEDPVGKLVKCPGEKSGITLKKKKKRRSSLAEFSAQSQAAVLSEEKAWHAAGHMHLIAERLHDTPASTVQMDDIKAVWHDTCTTLGCNTGSWDSIKDSLYGHTARLIQTGASAVSIYHNVKATRLAERAHMRILQSKSVEEALKGGRQHAFLSFATIAGSDVGHQSYAPIIQQSGEDLSAAYALLQVGHLDAEVDAVGSDENATDTDTADANVVDLNSDALAWGRRRRRRRRRRFFAGRRRRRFFGRRRRRGGFFKGVVNVVKKAGRWVAKAAKTVVKFVKKLFRCLKLQAKTTTGYSRSYTPYPPFTIDIAIEAPKFSAVKWAMKLAKWISKGASMCHKFPVRSTVRAGVGARGATLGYAFNANFNFNSCGHTTVDVSVAKCVSIAIPIKARGGRARAFRRGSRAFRRGRSYSRRASYRRRRSWSYRRRRSWSYRRRRSWSYRRRRSWSYRRRRSWSRRRRWRWRSALYQKDNDEAELTKMKAFDANKDGLIEEGEEEQVREESSFSRGCPRIPFIYPGVLQCKKVFSAGLVLMCGTFNFNTGKFKIKR